MVEIVLFPKYTDKFILLFFTITNLLNSFYY